MSAKASASGVCAHVGAADVERPGDVLRVRHHQRIGAQLGELGAHALELVGRAFAGELEIAQDHRLPVGGAGRSVHSASIGLSSTATSSAPAAAQALLQLLGALGGVQPGIVAELGAAFQVLLEPLLRRIVHQMLDGKDRSVDLRRRLHGVAAVDEQHGALGQHDGGAGRSGEAGEPGQPLLARRQIFVLLAVGARHHETVKPAALELGAQGGDAGGALRALARIVERLEAGLEHGRHSSALSGVSNAGMRRAPAGMAALSMLCRQRLEKIFARMAMPMRQQIGRLI